MERLNASYKKFVRFLLLSFLSYLLYIPISLAEGSSDFEEKIKVGLPCRITSSLSDLNAGRGHRDYDYDPDGSGPINIGDTWNALDIGATHPAGYDPYSGCNGLIPNTEEQKDPTQLHERFETYEALATWDGNLTLAPDNGNGYGNTLFITHDVSTHSTSYSTLDSFYGHLQPFDDFFTVEGGEVDQGDHVATIGSTGFSGGGVDYPTGTFYHIHFEVRENGAVDETAIPLDQWLFAYPTFELYAPVGEIPTPGATLTYEWKDMGVADYCLMIDNEGDGFYSDSEDEDLVSFSGSALRFEDGMVSLDVSLDYSTETVDWKVAPANEVDNCDGGSFDEWDGGSDDWNYGEEDLEEFFGTFYYGEDAAEAAADYHYEQGYCTAEDAEDYDYWDYLWDTFTDFFGLSKASLEGGSPTLRSESSGSDTCGVDFTSATLTGIVVDPDTNELQFIIETELAEEGDTLIDMTTTVDDMKQMFLQALAIPNHKQWISLDVLTDASGNRYGSAHTESPFDLTDLSDYFFDADVALKYDAFDSIWEDSSGDSWMNDWVNLVEGDARWSELDSLGFNTFPTWRVRAAIMPGDISAYATDGTVYIDSSQMTVDRSFLADTTIDLSHYAMSSSLQNHVYDLVDQFDVMMEARLNEGADNTQNLLNGEDEDYADLRAIYPVVAAAHWYKELQLENKPYESLIDSENLEGLFIENSPFEGIDWDDFAWNRLDNTASVTFNGSNQTWSAYGGVSLGDVEAELVGELTPELTSTIEAVSGYQVIESDSGFLMHAGFLDASLPNLISRGTETTNYFEVAENEATLLTYLGNAGTGESGDFTVKIYEEFENADGSSTRVLIETHEVDSMDRGTSITLETNWTPEEPGTHTFVSVIDTQNESDESNEADNERSDNIVVYSNDPELYLVYPVDRSVVQNTNIVLAAEAYDYIDEYELTIEWTSDVDGSLGEGTGLTIPELSPGTHTITASVENSRGKVSTAQSIIQVAEADHPYLTIQSPYNHQELSSHVAVDLMAEAADFTDGDLCAEEEEELGGDGHQHEGADLRAVSWASSIDGTLGEACEVSTELSIGTHELTFSATNSAGNTSSSTIEVTVVDGSPTVEVSLEDGVFTAIATDPQDGDLSEKTLWYSDRDGELGQGVSIMPTLSVGDHIIGAYVLDSNGLAGAYQLEITQASEESGGGVTEWSPPVLSIIRPRNNSDVVFGEELTLSATAMDEQDGDLAAQIEWTSDLSGALGMGSPLTISTLLIGTHTLTARVTDSHGLQSQLSTTLNVLQNAPTVTITAPEDRGLFAGGSSITFSDTAIDYEDGMLTGASLVWSSQLDGVFGTGESFESSALSLGVHLITVTATDSAGATDEAQILLVLRDPTEEFLSTFEDGSTYAELSFREASEETRYIELPADAIVSSAQARITSMVAAGDPEWEQETEGFALDGVEKIMWTQGISRSHPTFADIDEDGDLDLFVGEDYGNIHHYQNNGSGEFTLVTENFEGIDVGLYAAPTFADIDEDGDLDLFVGEDYGNIHHYQNNGSGEFTLVTENFEGIDVGSDSAPTFADIDEDGDLDLFVGEDYGNIHHYQNNGSGDFTLIAENFAGIDVAYSTPTFADIDEDGDLDLFVGEDYGNIHHYQNNGSGEFTLVTENFEGIDVGSDSAPTFADIDEDGDLNLFVGENYGNLNHYQNDGSGDFTLIAENFAGIDVGYESAPTFADIDGDGDLDLLIGEYGGGILFYRNVGFASVYTDSPSMNIGGEGSVEWEYEGEFSGSEVTDDFAEAINVYLEAYEGEEATVRVPLVFASEGQGALTVDSLAISYSAVDLTTPITEEEIPEGYSDPSMREEPTEEELEEALLDLDEMSPSIDELNVYPTSFELDESVSITVYASDDSGIASVTAEFEGTLYELTQTPPYTAFQTSFWPENVGEFPITVLVTDNAGLRTSEQVLLEVLDRDPLDTSIDYSVESVLIDYPVVMEQEELMTLTVVNWGGESAEEEVQIDFMVDDLVMETRSTELLQGIPVELEFSWIPTLGEHELTWVVDPEGLIEELDESNNTITRTMDGWDITEPTLSDLSYTDLIYEAGEMEVSVVVTDNVGIASVVAELLDPETEAVLFSSTLSLNPETSLYEAEFTAPSTGEYLLNLRAEDSSGIQTETSRTITVHSTLPDFAIDALDLSYETPLAEGETQVFSVDVTNQGGTDAEAELSLFVDGGIVTTSSAMVFAGTTQNITLEAVLAYGEHELEVRVDNANAVSESDETNNSLTRSIYVFDTQAPEAPEVSVTPAGWTDLHELNIAWTEPADPRGIADYELRVGEEEWISMVEETDLASLGFDYTSRLGGMQAGEHSIYVRAIDAAGNVGDIGIAHYQLDTSAPEAPILEGPYHAENYSSDTTPLFTWNPASDDASGVSFYEVSVSSESVMGELSEFMESTGSSTRYEPSFTDGIHTVKVRAYDALSHVSEWSNPVTVYIDTTAPEAPVISSTTHASGAWTANNEPEFTWTSPLDVASISGYGYLFDQNMDSVVDSIAQWMEGTSLTMSVLPMMTEEPISIPDGEWIFHVAAKDQLGHWSPTAHYQIQIDTTAPYTELIEPIPPLTADTVITLHAEDAGAGVEDTYFSFNGGPFVRGTGVRIPTPSSFTIDYYSVDQLGNTEEVKRYVFENEPDLEAQEPIYDSALSAIKIKGANVGSKSIPFSTRRGANQININGVMTWLKLWREDLVFVPDYLTAGLDFTQYKFTYLSPELDTLTPGSNTVEFCMDAHSILVEPDESNNCASLDFEYTNTPPALSASIDAFDPDSNAITYTFSNTSDVDLTQAFLAVNHPYIDPADTRDLKNSFAIIDKSAGLILYEESFFWSNDPNRDSYLAPYSTFTIESYMPDQEYVVSGLYALKICMDSANKILTEVNKLDNCAIYPFRYE